MAFLKTEAPSFDGAASEKERLARLEDYIVQHARELDYVLRHLSGSNMGRTMFSVGVADTEGTSLGTLGYTGSGVGAALGGAVCEVRSDGTYLLCGTNGVRVSESGLEITTNGGRTWADPFITASDEEPCEDGEASPGTSEGYARADHVHPVPSKAQEAYDAATAAQSKADDAYELADAKATITQLWENSSPGSSFAAQTVSISSLSNYDLIMIEVAYSATNSAIRASTTVGYEAGVIARPAVTGYLSSSAATVYRSFTLAADSITISTGTRATGSAVTDGTSYAIPLRVVGIKY